MVDKFIPVYQPYMVGNEKKYVQECLDTGWISSKGDFIHKFESAFADYLSVNHTVSVSNGTVALHLALLALDIKEGDEVIVPTLTYVASVNAIRYVGATPVFVDCDPVTWQMDPAKVAEKITAKTRAIMVVHLYGHPANMSSLTALAHQNRIYLIEDCAEAFGSKYQSDYVGSFGDIATFSFFGNKTITTGEGGMVVCNDDTFAKLLRLLRNQGASDSIQYWHDAIGYNYRMTNICAAIGLAQLEQADVILQRKRQLAENYNNRLANLPLTPHEEIGDLYHSYWMYSISLDDAKHRDKLRDYLHTKGIETRPVFYPVHHLPMYKQFTNEEFPISESISMRGINLPSWPGMTDKEIDFICQQIIYYFKN